MPAKLTIPSGIIVSTKTTTLPLTSTNDGYLETSDMMLNGSGQLVITKAKKYFVGFSVAFEQNGSGVNNVITVSVLKNGTSVLSNTFNYNVNDEMTINNFAYLNLNVNDVITVNVDFNVLSPNKLFILNVPTSTFLNVV